MFRLKGIWAEKNAYSKFIILVGFVLLSFGIFSTIGMALIEPIFGINLMADPTVMNDFHNPTIISIQKYLQLIQSISVFIFPPLAMAFVLDNDVKKYLKLDRKPLKQSWLFIIVIMLAAIPLINWLGMVNAHLTLPESISGFEKWMKDTEAKAGEITKAFLNMGTFGQFVFNLLLVAVLPAIGEELLFRGLLQKLFKDLTNNVHAGIWLSAILFSAMHMQFYGFLPRMLLGAYFGYLLLWSGSLWLPILAHFVNNGFAVLVEYLNKNTSLSIPGDTIGSSFSFQDMLYVLISVSVLVLLSLKIRKNETSRPI